MHELHKFFGREKHTVDSLITTILCVTTLALAPSIRCTDFDIFNYRNHEN